jgi:ankyrin repeat protein
LLYGHWLIVEYLLRFDKTLDINKPDLQDQPALCVAAQYNQPESVEVLLKAGADIEIRGSDSSTACFTAAREGNLEVLKVLHAAGCDIECPNRQGITAVGAGTLLLTLLYCILLLKLASR